MDELYYLCNENKGNDQLHGLMSILLFSSFRTDRPEQVPKGIIN